jgi:hypothetical protein
MHEQDMFDRARYTGYANNTKWSELREAMLRIHPNAPRFRVKSLNCVGDSRWDGEWFYHFKLDYVWKDMEWVELKSGSSETSIAADEITDICQRIGFEIERHGDFVRLIGYRQLGR